MEITVFASDNDLMLGRRAFIWINVIWRRFTSLGPNDIHNTALSAMKVVNIFSTKLWFESLIIHEYPLME